MTFVHHVLKDHHPEVPLPEDVTELLEEAPYNDAVTTAVKLLVGSHEATEAEWIVTDLAKCHDKEK